MRRKLVYFLLLLLTLAAALADQGMFLRFLLAFELLFAFAMAVWTRWMARKIKLSFLLAQNVILQGECVNARLYVKNTTWFPCGEIRAAFKIRDQSGWYKEEAQPEKLFTVSAGAGSRRTDCWETEICPSHCGMLKIELTQVRIFDYIGLCSVRSGGSAAVRYVSVLPRIHPWEPEDEARRGSDCQGCRDQAVSKPGFDTQEIFDTRFYQRGDILRKIHWKMSAKADDLIVKEFSQPADTAVRIAVDCECAEPSAVTPEQMDRLLENAAAVASYSLEQEQPCEFIWYAAPDEALHTGRIENERELFAALEELLGLCPYVSSAGHPSLADFLQDSDDGLIWITFDGIHTDV